MVQRNKRARQSLAAIGNISSASISNGSKSPPFDSGSAASEQNREATPTEVNELLSGAQPAHSANPLPAAIREGILSDGNQYLVPAPAFTPFRPLPTFSANFASPRQQFHQTNMYSPSFLQPQQMLPHTTGHLPESNEITAANALASGSHSVLQYLTWLEVRKSNTLLQSLIETVKANPHSDCCIRQNEVLSHLAPNISASPASNNRASTPTAVDMLFPDVAQLSLLQYSDSQTVSEIVRQYRNSSERNKLLLKLIDAIFTVAERQQATSEGSGKYSRLDSERVKWAKKVTFHYLPLTSFEREKETAKSLWKRVQGQVDSALRSRANRNSGIGQSASASAGEASEN